MPQATNFIVERLGAIKSLETLARVADGKATKIIIPSEIQNLAGLLATLKEVVREEPAGTDN